MFSTYVLRSLRDYKRYIGLSRKTQKRIIEHNAGVTRSTSGRRPFVLTYEESYETLKEARERERYFKTSGGRRFLNKVETPRWLEYMASHAPVAQLDTRPTERLIS